MNDNQLYACLLRIAQLQGQGLDRLALQTAVVAHAKVCKQDPKKAISLILRDLLFPSAKWHDAKKIDPSATPALLFDSVQGWSVLRGRNAQNNWVQESFDLDTQKWVESGSPAIGARFVCTLVLAKPFQSSKSNAYRMIVDALTVHRKSMLEIAVSGVMINLIALATSLYSMQVYDRVVPTGASQTLLALTLGVAAAITFELLIKFVKSGLHERLINDVDTQLARAIYARFLAIRMDQLPASVGSLASQLKGYEQVRGFLATVPAQLLIDAPFLFLYSIIVMSIGGWIGLIPLGFLLTSLVLGLANRKRVEFLTQKTNQANNLKTGLLVESVEGAETIKSGQGGWRMLMRWLSVADEARVSELEMRQVSERSQYWISYLHQASYIAMVAAGAMMVSRAEMTMGGLIACTILSGRILGPIATVPNMLVQWGHCKAALHALDRLWSLQDDHHGLPQPIVLSSVEGEFSLEGVQASYGNHPAMVVPSLRISPGEKIAVLGPVGAGKTTLLRLLSGMYKPQAGMVKLDGVDISHISKPVLSEQIGYLQQEGRLFAGTLRENLVLGLMDPGDQHLLEVAKLTGLHQSVLANHPLGLMQPISEGGLGLSGGQKQLTNLTRVFLRRPRIWLLDEPTASLDRQLENSVIGALKKEIRAQDTLVVVTHKPELLSIVHRVIVVVNHQIVMDGPRDEVVKKLQGSQTASSDSASALTPN